MAEFNDIKAMKADGWANCKQCGWFFKQSVLDECPMCHHNWKLPISYTQPPYEPPSLD